MFKILHECGLARTGKISTNRGSITTPALLLSVRNGDLHGLMPDAYNHFLHKTGILLNPLDYIGMKLNHQRTAAAEALNFHHAPFVLCFPRDPVQTEYLPSNNDKGVVVLLRPGQRQISPSFYTDLVKRLSPDAFVALWDQTPPDANEKRAMTGIYRNTKWLEKVLDATEDSSQTWATITNGKSEFLNKLASEKISVLNPQGYILDQFANKAQTAISIEELKYTMSCLDNRTLKMLPGKISPSEVLQAIQQGVDLFDSSLIWDLSLKGHAFVWTTPSVDKAIPSYTILDLNKDSHKLEMMKLFEEFELCRTDARPLMESCGCYTCTRHCRGYVHHLLREKEIIGEVLLQMHNVHWMLGFFQTIRDSINADRLLKVQFILQEN